MNQSKGAVAAGHPLSAEAAGEVLRAGGNAFDAALAALCAACVTEPVLASLGGGGFMLALPAGERPRLYDFFVQTPGIRRPAGEIDFRRIEVDFGSTTQAFHIGRGTAAVPGVVRGLFDVHEALGRMPLPEIVQPAVALASGGVEISAYQAYLLRVVRSIFAATEASLAIFGSRERAGELIGEGERLFQPELADALETLSREGPALFYHGEIASALVRDMAAGGLIGARDLAGYRCLPREPLVLERRSCQVLSNPPPSSGGLLIGFGLELLDSTALRRLEFGSHRHLALVAHALELTLEARAAALGTGEARTDRHALDESMLSPDFVARYRERVAPFPEAPRGTTQVSVIDANGNLAALSVSNGEGCGYVIPGTGIVMNNMLGESDLHPGGLHRWRENERMSSMMAPSAVRWPDRRLLALGSGGSNRIRTALLQVLVNLIDFELPLERAVHAPRIHFEDDLLSVEGGFDLDRIRPLLDAHPAHHLWGESNMFFGGTHCVLAEGSGFQALGDPRRGGAGLVAG